MQPYTEADADRDWGPHPFAAEPPEPFVRGDSVWDGTMGDAANYTAPPVRGSKPPLRLLGPDDPEVSSDLVYLDGETGGLVAVPPEAPTAEPPSISMFFEGRLITVHPAPDATAADVARLFAAQIPGARIEGDFILVERPWRRGAF